MQHILLSRVKQRDLIKKKCLIFIQSTACIACCCALVGLYGESILESLKKNNNVTTDSMPIESYQYEKQYKEPKKLTTIQSLSIKPSNDQETITTTQDSLSTPLGYMLTEPYDIISTLSLKSLEPVLKLVSLSQANKNEIFWQNKKATPLQIQLVINKLLPSSEVSNPYYITSAFGLRNDPFTGERTFHHGIDFYAPMGAPIGSLDQGLVSQATYSPTYGNVVEIDHGNGWHTRYAHCSKIIVRKGSYVNKGQIIALVGSEGRSTSTHLHFETIHYNTPINPINLIASIESFDEEDIFPKKQHGPTNMGQKT